jgi:cytochrome c oxidase subunit I
MTGPTAARPDDQVSDEGPRPTRWRGVIGFNLLSAIVLALLGYAIGEGIGQRIGTHIDFVAATDQNDVALLLGYVLAVVGWLVGLGFLNYPLGRMIGRSVDLPVREPRGIGRYFRFTTDHKVVGLQYFVGIGFFFFLGGLNAMLIRAELLSPDSKLFPPGQYLTIVSLHGTMMIMMMSSVILGPFGNYFVPLMIGAKGMAFPRIEALTFWLLPMAGVILFSAVWVGGISTGWTGYPTLADQAQRGMDSYVVAFALIAISLVLVGINMIATIVNMRAPGLTWQRLPIFIWSVLATSSLMVLGAPVLVGGLLMIALDRTASTSFFLPSGGGTPFLYENIFWFFGHPEVYILALPGFGVVLEILPVFSRKPLWGYRLAVAGMLGVCLLSFMVWQHHLFVSGINADLRPFYMFTTELISVPTGFIFLVAMGTIWRARIRYTVPMLFSLAFFFNFLIGGLSGVFLSDVPSDVSLHGSYFVMAHFHYTIMGGLVFAFFAGTYYWLPKMTGREFNERLAKVHFWGMFVAFNSTFLPLFAVGMMGMPRRVVTYAPHLQWLNDWVSVSAFCLGGFMLVFLVNLVWSQLIRPVAAAANPWSALSLEWQLPTPVPSGNFDRVPTILADPYQYGVPNALPVVDLAPTPLPVVS